MSQEDKENKNHNPPGLDESSTAEPYPHNVPSALVKVDLAAQSHQGHSRNTNEDHYLAVRMTRSLQTVLTNLGEGVLPARFEETVYGMLVADGIGSVAGGQIASSVALLRLLELVVETPDWIMKLNQPESAGTIMRRMTHRFRQIDHELKQRGELNRSLRGMGTTLTVAASLGADLFLSHIGDSRAYLLRNEKLHQLTTDHTLAQAMIDTGIATADDAATRAMRQVLTAALGSSGEPTDPQVQRLHLADGDQLLLCTDGLSQTLADDSIAAVLTEAESSEAACQVLIDLALTRGGKGNITVVLARYRFPQIDPGKEESGKEF